MVQAALEVQQFELCLSAILATLVSFLHQIMQLVATSARALNRPSKESAAAAFIIPID